MIFGTLLALYAVRNSIKIYLRTHEDEEIKEEYSYKNQMFTYVVALSPIGVAIFYLSVGKWLEALWLGLSGAILAYPYLRHMNAKKDNIVKNQPPKR